MELTYRADIDNEEDNWAPKNHNETLQMAYDLAGQEETALDHHSATILKADPASLEAQEIADSIRREKDHTFIDGKAMLTLDLKDPDFNMMEAFFIEEEKFRDNEDRSEQSSCCELDLIPLTEDD